MDGAKVLARRLSLEPKRFRSRLSVEKEFSIGAVRMNPYVRGELFYDSRFDEWSRTEWIGGTAFPLNRRLELDGYFDYQHDTGGDHNRKVEARLDGQPLFDDVPQAVLAP